MVGWSLGSLSFGSLACSHEPIHFFAAGGSSRHGAFLDAEISAAMLFSYRGEIEGGKRGTGVGGGWGGGIR